MILSFGCISNYIFLIYMVPDGKEFAPHVFIPFTLPQIDKSDK